VTFALPDDEETEDRDVLNVKKDSDEVKSSFEKRQEKVIIWNLRTFLYA
jgi:U3 small nucleolar RNA-associated protein MPP10